MATWEYAGGGLGLHVQSRNTGRGAHCCGKLKGKKPESIGKPIRAKLAQASEVQGLKGPGVTAVNARNRAI